MNKIIIFCCVQLLCLHVIKADGERGDFVMKVNDSTSFQGRLDSCVIDVYDTISHQYVRKYCLVWDSNKELLVRKDAKKIVSKNVEDDYSWADDDVMNNVLADRDYEYLLSSGFEFSDFSWDFTKNKSSYEKRRCKKIRNFKKLVAPPFHFKGIMGECDANEDGLTDYVIGIQGPDSLLPAPCNKDSLLNGTKNGFMLVLNKGRYFETDIRNDACFHSDNYEALYIGSYFPSSEDVEISGKTFSVEYTCGRYGTWGYVFSYQNGNYELTGYYAGGRHTFYPTDSSMKINFKNGVVSLWWENDAWEEEEIAETPPQERQTITAYYTISGGAPLLITDFGDDDY